MGSTRLTLWTWLVCTSAALNACATAPTAHATAPPSHVEQRVPKDLLTSEAPVPFTGLSASGVLSELQVLALLRRQPVVCLGETHDSTLDHLLQRDLVRSATQAAKADGVTLAVALEMLPYTAQENLAGYATGALSEAAFLEQSDWQKTWGFPFEIYRPVFQAALEQRTPLIALNAPRVITRQIAREGLSTLTGSERAQLPELVLDDPEHRSFFAAAMGEHSANIHGQLENYYAAQVTWDETMAEYAARWYVHERQQHPSTLPRLLIIAGAGHCHRSAIPRRLERRISQRVFATRMLGPSDLIGEHAPLNASFDLLLVRQ